MRFVFLWTAVALAALAAGPACAERLRLDCPAARDGRVQVGVLKPFDVYLVAERDSGKTELSAVAYRLRLPAGLLLAGEEIVVEPILGLGNSREGINLVFRCTDRPSQRVALFRLLATGPLENVVVALDAEPRTQFRGVVACRAETFEKFATPPDSLAVTAR